MCELIDQTGKGHVDDARVPVTGISVAIASCRCQHHVKRFTVKLVFLEFGLKGTNVVQEFAL